MKDKKFARRVREILSSICPGKMSDKEFLQKLERMSDIADSGVVSAVPESPASTVSLPSGYTCVAGEHVLLVVKCQGHYIGRVEQQCGAFIPHCLQSSQTFSGFHTLQDAVDALIRAHAEVVSAKTSKS